MKDTKKLKKFIDLNKRLPSHGRKNRTDITLSRWCCKMRKNKRNNKLSKDEVKKLEELDGWWWEK